MRPTTALLLAVLSTAPAAAAAQHPARGEPTPTAGYYFLLGRQLEFEGRVDEAIKAHRQAIALEPASAELKAELAALYARQDRAREAVELARAALAHDPANIEANRILGSVYASLAEAQTPLAPGDDVSRYPAQAIAALEAASGDGRGDLGTALLLARMYIRTQAFERAVPLLRRVVEEQPGYSEAAWLLAASLEQSGKDEDAVAVLERAVADNPRFYRGRLRLAELSEKLGRWRDAAEHYAEAQQFNPRGGELATRRAAALINAGRAEDARDLLAERAAAPESDVAVLYLYAVAQRQSDDLDGAAKTLARLRAAAPDDPRGLYVEAQILEAKGDTDGAERSLRAILARDPQDATALNFLGYMFAERGARLDEAVELVKRALLIEPDNPSFLDSLGWAYFRQGRLDLADRPLTDAAAKLPHSSVVQDHLGDLRYKQGRYADAIAAWERSLAGDGESVDKTVIERKLREARARQ